MILKEKTWIYHYNNNEFIETMKDHLIHLTEEDLDKPIYRIFSFKRLEEIFKEKKLTLAKPKKWDDPFENFILNSTGTLPDGREFQIGFRDNYYGQCWSLTVESDAMWRIYSPEKDGVKVKTTIRKLFQPLFEAGEIYHKTDGTPFNTSSFVGKVRYSKTSTLLDMLKDKKRMSNKIFDQTGWGQASTFFFKRTAFKHEKEVRIIYNSQKNTDDFYKINIDPFDLFDNIVFDPRMKEEDFKNYKKQLRDWGYKRIIYQSSLYKVRKFTLSLNQEETES